MPIAFIKLKKCQKCEAVEMVYKKQFEQNQTDQIQKKND